VVGAGAGAAAGGVLGAQTPGGGIGSALGTVGGSLVGGLIGNSVEHATGDTPAWEYVVREEDKGDLVSVSQKDTVPLKVGAKVLVIAGKQARIVPDYTVDLATPAPIAPAKTQPPQDVAPPPAPVATAPLPDPATVATH
jgi:outer membrane lipoprotein SlyB